METDSSGEGGLMERRLAAVLATVLLAILSACTGPAQDEDRPKVDGAVVQPGRPGEKSKTLDEAPRIEEAEANDADIMFTQMMIPHHAQALQMSKLATDAGAGRSVQVLADRIDGAQRPEIVYMAGWLEDRGEDAPTAEEIKDGDMGAMSKGHGGHGGHGSGSHTMPGMATAGQLRDLADARGADFDDFFLTLMIRHHRGAVDMAGEVLRDGSEQQLNELASGIAADQGAEISRMEDLLGR